MVSWLRAWLRPACSPDIRMTEAPSGTFTGRCACGHPINVRTYALIRPALAEHIRYRMAL